MTYLSKRITPIKVDVLRVQGNSTGTNPWVMHPTGTANNTSATFSTTTHRITLPAGSHWRIVWQMGAYTFAGDAASTAQHTGGIYSVNDSVYLGQEGIATPWNSGIKGRSSASALILNSQITNYLEIELHYKSIDSDYVYRGNLGYYSHHGVIIMELPA